MNKGLSVPWWFLLYFAWMVVTVLLIFWQYGWSQGNITRISIIIYFALTLTYALKRVKEGRDISSRRSKLFFILACLFSAAAGEGFYMVSEPVFASLKIVPGMGIEQMIRNYAIDLAFTMPLALFIYRMIWNFIQKYDYTLWQFSFIIALSMALIDGGSTFIREPGLLIFLPYVMLNYHAVTVPPYLLIRKNIRKENLSPSLFKKICAPLFLIPLTYLIWGIYITNVARGFGLR